MKKRHIKISEFKDSLHYRRTFIRFILKMRKGKMPLLTMKTWKGCTSLVLFPGILLNRAASLKEFQLVLCDHEILEIVF